MKERQEKTGTSWVACAKTLRSQCQGPGSLPGQGTRPHVLLLRSGAAK